MNLTDLKTPALRYFSSPAMCCANELVQAESSRYDLERLGCYRTTTIEDADVLVILGAVTESIAQELVVLYHKMPKPQRVIVAGTCGCGGGLFPFLGQQTFVDPKSLFPIDLYVPGCPPRPEALIRAFVDLKSKVTP